MSIRFQADADLNLAIVLALTRKEPGLDFRTAFDAGFAGLRDDEVLAAAAKTDRVLVSHDRRLIEATADRLLLVADGKVYAGERAWSEKAVLIVSEQLDQQRARRKLGSGDD